MTIWPVNWIEQDQVYQQLLDEYEKRLAQATPVLVYSFNEPSQDQWEDAYVKQTGRIPPILPGKLRWFDLKNGTVKSYSTIYKDGGVDVDPVVRPIAAKANSWGAIRLLGVTRNINTIGFPLDLTTFINKGLVMLMIHWPASNTSTAGFQVGDANWYSKLNQKSPSGGNSTQVGGGTVIGLRTIYLLNPYTERLSDGTYVLRYSGTNAMAEGGGNLAGSQAQAYWQSNGAPGSTANSQDLAQMLASVLPYIGWIYGVFASDPGYIEEFEIV